MPVVDTTNSFVNNEQITSVKLNNIMDNSFFVSDAVVPGQGLQITAGGQMTTSNIPGANIASGTITGGTSGKIANDTITDLNINASAAIAGSKLADNSTSGAKITDASIPATKLNGAQAGTAPVFGVRAWVNFQGTATANISGTAVRLSGSTTATITITNHGLLTGHRVYIDFGATIADSSYTITKVDNNTFTIVTGASTAVTTTATVVLVVIRAGGNVSCVSKPTTGVFLINFTAAMPNAFYAGVCSTNNTSQPRFAALNRADSTNQYAKVETDDAQPSPSNFDENSVIIIG
jgi:hypothetical protein